MNNRNKKAEVWKMSFALQNPHYSPAIFILRYIRRNVKEE
jgi:hypothetical protein